MFVSDLFYQAITISKKCGNTQNCFSNPARKPHFFPLFFVIFYIFNFSGWNTKISFFIPCDKRNNTVVCTRQQEAQISFNSLPFLIFHSMSTPFAQKQCSKLIWLESKFVLVNLVHFTKSVFNFFLKFIKSVMLANRLV